MLIGNFQDYTHVHVVVIISLGVDWVRSKDDTRHCDKDSGERNQPDVAFPFAELHPHFLHRGTQGQVFGHFRYNFALNAARTCEKPNRKLLPP